MKCVFLSALLFVSAFLTHDVYSQTTDQVPAVEVQQNGYNEIVDPLLVGVTMDKHETKVGDYVFSIMVAGNKIAEVLYSDIKPRVFEEPEEYRGRLNGMVRRARNEHKFIWIKMDRWNALHPTLIFEIVDEKYLPQVEIEERLKKIEARLDRLEEKVR